MTLIGNSIPRTDAVEKVSGKSVYGVDVGVLGMLHGCLLRSPVPCGTIARLDTTAAISMPGVRYICTSADQPDTRAGWVLCEQHLFATECVRYEGEPIAAVVADSREQARAAVNAIDLQIEERPGVDLIAAMADDPATDLVHPEWETYQPLAGPETDHPRHRNVAAQMSSDPDDVDLIFEQADLVVEDELISHRQYQAYIEPKSAIAMFADGRYTIHTASQYPFNVRDRVAQFLGIRPSNVRVVGHTIGGGFGGKLDAALEPIAAFMAKQTGHPVRIANDRTEDLLTCPSRENAVVKIRTALDADGRMTARELLCDMDNGAYSAESIWLASLPLHLAKGVYQVGPTRVISRLHYTNTAPTGAFRGVGGTYLYAAVERHMDSIADTLGIDRRQYRLDHLLDTGDTLLNGQVLENTSTLKTAFERLDEILPWDEANKAKGPYEGLGIAGCVWLTNPMPGQATVKVNEDGTITVITSATDNGSGALAMGITQIVAEEFGVAPEEVHITSPDTDVTGYDSGSQGSRTTHIVGRAALDASHKAKEQLFEVAAGMLEANPADMRIVDGEIGVVGAPGSRVSLGEVAATATWTIGPIVAAASYTTPPVDFNPACASGLLFPTMPTPTYHAHMAAVEVDPITGQIEVQRYAVAQDVGRAINPIGVRGQIQGAVAQGIGHTIYESLQIQECRYLERSLENYRLPLAIDIPTVEFVLIEDPDSEGPYGAKGVAEPPITLVSAVIANAVSDAIGAPITKIPITPEDVLEALG
ncbi:MAG TPA: aldehyde oxidase [Acidimicrobiaceae bacterium]|nr:aldehyde oxidase [Acidimicrobiaceae bacterium]